MSIQPTHDANGKFLAGHRLGSNPCAGAQMRFRARLQYIADEVEKGEQNSRFDRLARAIFKKAIDGEQWAVRELFDRLMGRIPESDDGDTPSKSNPTIVVVSSDSAEAKLGQFGARMARLTQEQETKTDVAT